MTVRPTAHTLQQRAAEASHSRQAELAAGAAILQELNGSTRRDIAEVWWAETRRRTER